jgi:GNAT superfamily N-acetyltransferase
MPGPEDAAGAPAIRLARTEDGRGLVGLMTEFYAEAGFPLDPDPARRAFARLLGDRALGRIWIAEDAGTPVGYLVLTFGFSMEFGAPRGFVDDFFVRPAARGRGLGEAMLAAVREHCLGEGIAALLVETGLEGHPARRLYHRAGFVDSGRALLSQALAAPVHEQA